MASDRPNDPAAAAELSTALLARPSVERRPLGALLRAEGIRPFRFEEGKCILGSGAGSDVIIAATGVSRQHAELELVPQGVRVRDLGSRNGTYYIGQRIESVVLALGAVISLGSTTVTIDADTESLGQAIYGKDSFREMVGASVAMRRIFALLDRLSGSLATVLVGGESGVGKELVARALHDGSPVANGPFVVVNCGAISRDLVVSELFGHRKGSFTGATDHRTGAFEAADGGTLFLDEIAELPLDAQPILLRALEASEVRPIGADAPRTVRVRVVAATNRRLEEEVAAGRFRDDLFYRLAVVRLDVPPLRARPEDVPLLAEHFARRLGLVLEPHVMEQLKFRSWPGNVRELRNAIQVFGAIGSLPQLTSANAAAFDASLGDLVDLTRPYAEQKEELGQRFTRVYLQQLLAHTGGNQTEAARIASLDRTYLGRLLVKLGLSRS